jgi:HEAT repeat protein
MRFGAVQNLLSQQNKNLNKWLEITASTEFSESEKLAVINKLIDSKSKGVTALISILKDKNHTNHTIRRAVIEGFGKIGSPAAEAVPNLLEELSDDNNSMPVRRMAASAIGSIGKAATIAIPELVDTLNQNDPEISQAAAEALNKIDPQWSRNEKIQDKVFKAIPFFIKVLAEKDSHSSQFAARILDQTDPNKWPQNETERRQKIIPILVIALVKALVNHEKDVYSVIENILDKLDPEWSQSETAARLLPILVKAKVDNRSLVKNLATKTLAKIDPTGKKTISAIVEARIDNSSKNRRKLATNVLKLLNEISPDWKQGESAHDSIPELIKARLSPDEEIREAADKLLNQITPSWARGETARGLVPYFIEILRTSTLDARCRAVETLGEMGPPIKEDVSDHFRALLEDNKAIPGRLFYSLEYAWDKIDTTKKWREDLRNLLEDVRAAQREAESAAPWAGTIK